MINELTFDVPWYDEKLTFKAVLNSYEPHIFLFDEYVGTLNSRDYAEIDYDRGIHFFMKDETAIALSKALGQKDVSTIVDQINIICSCSTASSAVEFAVLKIATLIDSSDTILANWLLRSFDKSESDDFEYAGPFAVALVGHVESEKIYDEQMSEMCCGLERWTDKDYKGRLWKFAFSYGH